MKKYQTTGVYITLLVIMTAFIASLMTANTNVIKDISYSTFVNKVKTGEIQKVVITDDFLTAEASEGADRQPVKYRVFIPLNDSSFLQKLEENNVDINVSRPGKSGQWIGLIGTLIFPLFLLIALFLMFRSASAGGSQAMSFGKSKAKMMLDNKVKITFDDVAGIDESKQELEEVVDFLKNSQKYLSLGAKIPRGVLLVGSPGTGKTLLAKAVAGEAGVPFFSISGSDFVEMFVGVGASRVRDLFEQAKKHAPCIVFIDEIDAVGRQRGAGLGGGHDEREQTLNQLLVEMDGFDGTTGIIIVAATNRPDILDNALLRPGRFDRQVVIDRPDVYGREQILEVHSKGKPFAPEVNLKTLAKRTPGFTGADLSNLINEAALLAARLDKKEIEMSDLEESIDKVMVGIERKSKVISDEDKEVIAYHEVGHALLNKLLKNTDPFHKVTIIPRGFALGISWSLPDDSVHTSKSRLMNRIAVALGGRISEEIIFGAENITAGASSDIEKVTEIARKMVTAYGMSDKIGPVQVGKKNEHVFLGRDFGSDKNYSEEIASTVDREIKNIIEERYDFAKNLLTENKDIIEEIVKVLLEQETLDEKEVDEIIERVKADREHQPA